MTDLRSWPSCSLRVSHLGRPPAVNQPRSAGLHRRSRSEETSMPRSPRQCGQELSAESHQSIARKCRWAREQVDSDPCRNYGRRHYEPQAGANSDVAENPCRRNSLRSPPTGPDPSWPTNGKQSREPPRIRIIRLSGRGDAEIAKNFAGHPVSHVRSPPQWYGFRREDRGFARENTKNAHPDSRRDQAKGKSCVRIVGW